MATIGLYDIDLWHKGRSAPNLELMKIYHYFKNNNQIVKMMRPQENEGRYNSIIYFKDNPNTQIPRSLILNGDKKTVYGYGFYNIYSPLKPEMAECAPSYDLYDPVSYKLSIPNQSYDELKKNSLIRLESNDFSDYKKDRMKMTFVDHNFFYVDGAYDCLLDFKNHRFSFYHPLWVKDAETFYKFERFCTLINSYIIIDFRYDENFFFENFSNPSIIFKFEKRPEETILNYQLRYVKMGIFYKKAGIRMKFPFHPQPVDDLDKKIIEWLKSASRESFVTTYPNVVNVPSELRVLLKQDPKKIESSHLDFSQNL